MAATKSYGVRVRRSEPLRLSMHPQAPSQGNYRSWMLESERPLAIDLFSGAGGLSHGLEAAGFRVALAVDLDDWALETHAHNFEGVALQLDLGEKDVRDSIVRLFDGIDITLLAGGPPCQPYSRAGRSKIRSLVEMGARDADDHRRQLWKSFLDVAETLQPQAVLMENVPDMALGDDMAVMRHMLARLEAVGYEADARLVDTWDYGVPQHRQRLVIVGVREGRNFVWPEPWEQVTVRDAIADLPVLDPTEAEVGAMELPYSGPLSEFQRRARKRCDGDAENLIFDHVTRTVRTDDLEAFQLMKPGTLYSDLPEELRRYRADIFDDKYNRLGWEELSRSITAHIAKDGYWYIHPDQHRTLTVREAARIQTFPDHFRFAGSRSHQFAQIGNAVPPSLGEAIGGAVLLALQDRPPKSSARISVWRAAVRDRLSVWAEADRVKVPWAYPTEAWNVLVGLILGGKGDVGWPDPGAALELVPTADDATPQMMAVLDVMADPGRRRREVQRLGRTAVALRGDTGGWNGLAWRRAAGLGPAAQEWLDLLAFDSGGLAPSSSVLRVTARVTGSDVDERNRMSKGRMELAMLVGDGDTAATLNAALHRLGSQVCAAENPDCQRCPLRTLCRSAACQR
jgi:DNA (cytosine-5)-methyltransferase 1